MGYSAGRKGPSSRRRGGPRGVSKAFLRRGDLDLRGSLRRSRSIVVLVVLGGFTMLVLLAALFGEQGYFKVRELNREKAELNSGIAGLESETGSLRRRIRGMQSDPFLYEKAARERLGLVKPGEVVYDFRRDPLEED